MAFQLTESARKTGSVHGSNSDCVILIDSNQTNSSSLYSDSGNDSVATLVRNLSHRPLKKLRKITSPKAKKKKNRASKREIFESKQKFLVSLSQDLAFYGSPTHRVEHLLETVGHAIGLQECSFFVLPGIYFI